MRSTWLRRTRQLALAAAALLYLAHAARAQEPRPAGFGLPVAPSRPSLEAPAEPVGVASSGPQESPPPGGVAAAPDDLKGRVEALERQNRELLGALREVQPVAAQESKEAKGTETGPPPGALTNRADVEKAVADALKKRDDKKKQDDAKKKQEDAKKKQEEALKGFTVGQSLGLTPKWKHGLWLESADQAFKVHVGGRTQFDIVGVQAGDNVQFGPGGIGRFDDAVNFRRARLTVDGTFYDIFDFVCEYDFINTFDTGASLATPQTGIVQNTPVPTDLWVQISHIPWIGHVRAGNQKPWISFEHMTSSRFLNFMERSVVFDAFHEEGNNGFTPGISAWNNWGPDDRGHWGLGAYKMNRTIMGWNVGDGEYSLVGRATYLPVYKDEGRYLLHVGLGGAWKGTDDEQVRFRARPELRNGPAVLHNIVAQGRVVGETEYLATPELVANVGPFTLQSEYTGAWVPGVTSIVTTPTQRNAPVSRRSYFAQGAYVEALYFLTGEHRPYNKSIGAFDRVIPFRNYFFVPGVGGNCFQGGAWQVALRYSYLDLTNNGIDGGQLNEATAGLNWFLNPNFKVQWNYTYGYRSVGAPSSGVYQAGGVRFAFDF